MENFEDRPRDVSAAVQGFNDFCRRNHVEDNVKNTRLDLRQPLSTKIAVRLHLESLQETGRVFWLET
jgi:hypothetical protein